MTKPTELISLRQLWELSGLSKSLSFKTVQNRCCRGEFKSYKIFGRRYVNLSEWEQWLKEQATPDNIANMSQWRK